MFLKIKSFIQRGRRGWANSDIWDFDCYLADIIAEGTKHLLKSQHGYPGSLTQEEWDKKLEEIIWAFEYLRDSCDIWIQDTKRFGSIKAEQQEVKNKLRAKKGLEVFIEHFQDLWD